MITTCTHQEKRHSSLRQKGLLMCSVLFLRLPWCIVVKNLIFGSGRSLGEVNGNPFPGGNPMDRGAWWATVHGVTKESDLT